MRTSCTRDVVGKPRNVTGCDFAFARVHVTRQNLYDIIFMRCNDQAIKISDTIIPVLTEDATECQGKP